MALTPDFVKAHIQKWEAELAKPLHSYRSKWPSRLFHHSPIENAVDIIKAGLLRSRNDPDNTNFKDVAAQGVIAAQNLAHGSVRLYFRPRTPTQWHIEGIRKASECAYGDASHAPILIMFVFDAIKVLTTQGVRFSDRNMQSQHALLDDTENHFSKVPFEKVFHEGSTANDASIIQHRCAEVLATSPLQLEDNLQCIFCRTNAEREMLLFLLDDRAQKWQKKILVSDDNLVFERKYAFVRFVGVSREGLSFDLNPRLDNKTVSIAVEGWDEANVKIVNYTSAEFNSRPANPNERWIFRRPLNDGTYRVKITLEGKLAYENKLILRPTLV